MREPGTCSAELERPETDRFLNETVLAAFIGRIDRGRRGEEVEARIDPLGQRHLQREVVDLLQPRDLLRLVLLDLGCALDQADEARARIGLRAVHDAVIGPDQVVGRHLAAVVEVGVVAQLEGVHQSVVRDGDVLGEFQHRLALRRVPDVERAVQTLAENLVLRALRRVDVHRREARPIGRGEADGAARARRLRHGRGGQRHSQAGRDQDLAEHEYLSDCTGVFQTMS